MAILPPKVEIDFTDELLTSKGGLTFLARFASLLHLPQMLAQNINLKLRNRGPSDAQYLLSLIYSMALGEGDLCDVDLLKEDLAQRTLAGLEEVPDSRRVSEYLCRFDEPSLTSLSDIAETISSQLVDSVVRYELSHRGWLPIFVDGTAIEVYGRYFEKAENLYNGQKGFWLHGAFIGNLWVKQRLYPGKVHPAKGYQELIEAVVKLLPEGTRGYFLMDAAYYNKEVVSLLKEAGQDYSISVTHGVHKKPLYELVQSLDEDAWEKIKDDGTEEAAFIYYQPTGWPEEETYVVVRQKEDGGQRRLFPRYRFILVSRKDLGLRELVRRHRQKQGQENLLKGPLRDLGLHHPPCQRFVANRAYYTLGQIAHLLLVGLQHKLLPEVARKCRPQTVIKHFLRVAAKVVRHARRLKVWFTKQIVHIDWIDFAASRLEEGLLFI